MFCSIVGGIVEVGIVIIHKARGMVAGKTIAVILTIAGKMIIKAIEAVIQIAARQIL